MAASASVADRTAIGSRGFTLIEVMVALAVFGLAAMALIRLQGETIRGAATLDATVTAQMVARNLVVEAITDAEPPVTGITRGIADNGGRSWRWQRSVGPTGDPRILRIDVGVADPAGRVLGRLSAVRPPPLPVQVTAPSSPAGVATS